MFGNNNGAQSEVQDLTSLILRVSLRKWVQMNRALICKWDTTWCCQIELLIRLWDLIQFPLLISNMMKFKTSFKENWLKKLDVLCADFSHTCHLNADSATKSSANTANSNFRKTQKSCRMKLLSRPWWKKPVKSSREVQMLEELKPWDGWPETEDNKWVINLIDKLPTRWCSAPTVNAKAIAWLKLTQLSETASISVSSLTSAISFKMARSSGNQSESSKVTLLTTSAPSMVATSATSQNTKAWLDPNLESTSRDIVPKLWSNARFAAKSIAETNSPTTSASRITISKNWSKITSKWLSTWPKRWWNTNVKRRSLVSAPNHLALQDIEKAVVNNLRQWFKPDRTLIQLSVVNVRLLLRARKKHTSAPFVTRIIVVAALAITFNTTSKNLRISLMVSV